MPITANFVERLATRCNSAPAVLFDFLGAQAFRAVCAAVELRLFEAIAERPLQASEVARLIEASERGVRLLLEALESLGYVTRSGDRFAATRATKKWLLRRSPVSLATTIPFFDGMVFDRWANLAESIRRGEPVINGYAWLSECPARWTDYEEAMLSIARVAAREVVSKTKLPRSALHLLDLGGGHGLYAIEFCRRYGNLSATILDLAPALALARRTIATEKMEARVTTVESDMLAGNLGGCYDVVLVFNLLHGFESAQNAELLGNVLRSLNSGGMAVVLEQTDGQAVQGASNALARLQALNFFNDLGTRTYTTDEIGAWLASAGFHDSSVRALRTLPGFTLVFASKIE